MCSRVAARRRSSYAAGAGGFGDDLQLAAVGGELDDGLGLFSADQRWRAAVGLASAELLQGGVEAAQVVLAHGGDDVDTAGDCPDARSVQGVRRRSVAAPSARARTMQPHTTATSTANRTPSVSAAACASAS